MSQIECVDTAEVAGKRVLLRVDLNVPLRDGIVSDFTRIERVIPTIKDLLERGAVVILISHLGRPNGEVVPEFSLQPIAEALATRLGQSVTFIATDWSNESAAGSSEGLMPGHVALMENVRFHPGEEANDPEFSSQIAALGELYVNDAFSSAHRAHASTVGIAYHLPAFAGRAMLAEISALTDALDSPKRPVIAIVGGAKISSKIAVLRNLLDKVNYLVIGGAMANTFIYAEGGSIGLSLHEPTQDYVARDIMEAAREKGCQIVLPLDVMTARELVPNVKSELSQLHQIAADDMILDVGPRTVEYVNNLIDQNATFLWNGPLGAFEVPPFDRSTMDIARHVGERVQSGDLIAVAGGGDTVAALNAAGVVEDFTYVSTAGGAFLEWLEGKELPGVAALMR
jgi:phosphoglycerate kinase